MRLDGRNQSPLSHTTWSRFSGRGREGQSEGTYGHPMCPSPRPSPRVRGEATKCAPHARMLQAKTLD